jgi:tripartite ATP-independent transporter DctP family solute receptor
MRRLAFLSGLLVFLLAGCSRSLAKEESPLLILRYADNQPIDYPTTTAARYFSALVSDRTEGKIQIRVFGGGELGEELEVLDQVAYGGVDFSRFSLGTFSKFQPQTKVLQLPYLYRDSAHMWRVLDGPIGEAFLASMQRYGAVGLCWFDAGARSFYTTEPVNRLEDLQGKVIRVQESDLMSEMIRLLGARSVQIPYGSVYSALQTHKIDGAENNIPSYQFTGHYEAAPYLFLDEHFRLPEVVLMSFAAKGKIAMVEPSFVGVVMQCAKEASLYERELWRKAELECEEKLKASGCTITYPEQAEIARWREAMRGIYDQFAGEDAEIIRQIQSQ